MVNGLTLDQTSRVACVSCRNAFTMVGTLVHHSMHNSLTRISSLYRQTNPLPLVLLLWTNNGKGCKSNRIWNWIFHLQFIHETSWNQGAGTWIRGVLFYMQARALRWCTYHLCLQYHLLATITVLIGCFFVIIFHLGTKEPRFVIF